MLPQDLTGLVRRLDRIASAIHIGCDALDQGDRPDVRAAVTETCAEALRVGHVLTRALAYDGLWNDLDLVCEVWRRIDAQADRVRLVDVRALPDATIARAVTDDLTTVRDAVRALDEAQLQAVARPRDRSAVERATAAIAQLEAAADRLFVAAVLDDRSGRLDAAMAVLTTVAARAARERATVGVRRG